MLNSKIMKVENQKQILNHLILKSYSRAELAGITGLTKAAVSKIIDGMLQKDLLLEKTTIINKAGRNPLLLSINPDIYHIGYVNIERDIYNVGVTDFCGKVLGSRRIVSCKFESAHNALEAMTEILAEILKKPYCKGTLLGIGIIAPGPLNIEDGIILNPPNFEQWHGIEIVRFFRGIFDCRVLLENNANALAIAEYYNCIRGQYNNFLELYVGAGIGGGLFLDNRIYRGYSGAAGEIGHMSLNIEGPGCDCGNFGCAELYASIPQILKYASDINQHYCKWSDIIDDAYINIETAVKVINKEAYYISMLLVSVLNALNIEAVVITGDITYRGEMLVEMISKDVRKSTINKKKVPIILSGLTETQRIVTGINLIIENYINQI